MDRLLLSVPAALEAAEHEASREAEAEDHLNLPDGDGEGNRQSVNCMAYCLTHGDGQHD